MGREWVEGGENKQRNSSSFQQPGEKIIKSHLGAVVVCFFCFVFWGFPPPPKSILKTPLSYVYLPGVYFLKVTERFTRILISNWLTDANRARPIWATTRPAWLIALLDHSPAALCCYCAQHSWDSTCLTPDLPAARPMLLWSEPFSIITSSPWQPREGDPFLSK